MPRHPRDLRTGLTYHVTVRCNNRRFDLSRKECRDVLLFALKRIKERYQFKLYGVCIMSNHVHYLIEPKVGEDLPKIMHWLNWYTAMSFNRMLKRTGHFWEQRYYSRGFATTDLMQGLAILRYIHNNPRAAGIRKSLCYGSRNYVTYQRLAEDGITDWHPAFLRLATTLDGCVRRYRQYCLRYDPQRKPGGRRSAWGGQRLKLPKRRQTSFSVPNR